MEYNNEGYDVFSVHPTNAAWLKRTNYAGPSKIKSIKWKVPFTETISSSRPVIDRDSNIIFGTHYGKVTSISKVGDVNWSYFCEEGSISSPVIGSDRNIYMIFSDYNHNVGHKLLCLSPSGNEAWSCLIDDDFHFEPILDREGSIYVTTWSKLIKISPEGEIIWEYQCRNISTCPVVDGKGDLYFSSRGVVEDEGVLISLTSNGQLRWSKEIGKCYLEYEPIIDEHGNLYMIASQENKHVLYSIRQDGTVNWVYMPNNNNGIVSSPALSKEGYIIVGITSFKVIAVDLNGVLIWETDIGHITQYTPIVDCEGKIYLQTTVKKKKSQSFLWCLEKDGQISWNYKVNGAMQWFHFGENSLHTITVESDSYLLELTSFEVYR
ncbi:Pyrrolo-quinoline quinone beta-propeller repeat protein [Paenibacillus curdlanolyticus YK9]|uniref:Pyrrolo-quinoline quinone beta-propeller repeat protein n=1 Tax=Paenibacillus curdlanolyticus YK9 TaxID=717606 RepID=E0IFC9_9BACL|nr:PQQ-binding-like beta-propeller repeat protein [Paenibacillus curdlanolyticus]EFM08905.1 Pyrrolo-quinoline quinone beta-propeller repeat protein [Paenibacillus curdlanolyticus YK9]